MSSKIKFSNIFGSCRLVFFDKSQEKVNHIILTSSSDLWLEELWLGKSWSAVSRDLVRRLVNR